MAFEGPSDYPFSRLQEIAGDLEVPGLGFDQKAEWLRQHLRHEIQRRRREVGGSWDVLDSTLQARERRNGNGAGRTSNSTKDLS